MVRKRTLRHCTFNLEMELFRVRIKAGDSCSGLTWNILNAPQFFALESARLQEP